MMVLDHVVLLAAVAVLWALFVASLIASWGAPWE